MLLVTALGSVCSTLFLTAIKTAGALMATGAMCGWKRADIRRGLRFMQRQSTEDYNREQ